MVGVGGMVEVKSRQLYLNSNKKKLRKKRKNSMGNGEAKELTCMTHGHELRRGMYVGRGMQGREE